ncbi:hypothetical protein TOPH_07317 [Tolypocladium ophioglossoides CBS 100239]|uniref:MHYT domain-containing protein n=1 Tax=Tolypocladium ophioglossoides (strain CBS 100239) TaxID=1163406 RepID=A0A0L0N1U5_TOLOC|nr:hypothetical protein TOPH_07317 [Tolypocladium ophioglossoides CBS 100239]
MSTAQDLLEEYSGRLVPFSFRAGFVCLSYAISLVGTCSTLELIRRRTSHKGVHNLLMCSGTDCCYSALPSPWAALQYGPCLFLAVLTVTPSKHFIGNRAIYILDGDEQLQIAYSTSLTVLSLLVPIMVLLLAFLGVSGNMNGQTRWWRILLASSLAGGSICGMHYLADASISNYDSSYEIANVVGAALIAVSASTAALALFFVFEATWKNEWWKRLGCAMVLAGAVSGMHWCAAVGTSYRLLHLYSPGKGMSRHETMIVVICLSVAAGVVMTASGIYSSWIRRDYASKSQQVVLAAAVFDDRGRIMVNQEGFLPSEVVTDTFLPKSNNDVFGTTHPLFHWMFRASRNWATIEKITDKMANHIAYLSHQKYNSRTGLKLVGEDGMLVPYYDTILSELFCLAALALASRTKETLANAGILWDEIFTTGNSSKHDASRTGRSSQHNKASKDRSIFNGLAEKGLAPTHQEYGRGCLMFLVRQVNCRRDMEKLEAAGYRFAEVHQVVSSILSSMQIKTPDLAEKLLSMSAHAQCKKSAMLGPGVHLGLFAVRARLDHCGFDRLEPWQTIFLDRLRGNTLAAIIRKLDGTGNLSAQEGQFACNLRDAVSALRQSLEHAIFDDATLLAKVVQAPCSTLDENSGPARCSLIAFRLVLPIHSTLQLSQYEFSPLNFFKVRQLVLEDSPHHLEFSHLVHRELSSAMHDIPAAPPCTSSPGNHTSSVSRALAKLGTAVSSHRAHGISGQVSTRSQERLSAVVSNHDSSLNPDDDSIFDDGRKLSSIRVSSEDAVDQKPKTQQRTKQLFGGIMVSQEIVVHVREASPCLLEHNEEINDVEKAQHARRNSSDLVAVRDRADSAVRQDKYNAAVAAGEFGAMTDKEQRGSAFVDELLALCMEKLQQ